MRGYIRRVGNVNRAVLAAAAWQDLNKTILGNRRKRKPEWIINFSWTHIPYNNGSDGSVNERMTREQAQALVNVLTKLLATEPANGAQEFVEFEPELVRRVTA